MAGLQVKRAITGALAALLAACSQPPREVPLKDIAFPVVLITGSSPRDQVSHSADIEINARNLGLMRVELYSGISDQTLSDAPIVIDSNARIYDMTEIKGQHGSLWMMINPTGLMPITFKLLERKDQGLEAAKALINGCEYMGRDLDDERRDQRRSRIGEAKGMAEIVWIVDEVPREEAETK